MKKTIIPIVILYSFVSCLPVFDFAESMRIKNCTIDTIICGTSIDDSIDSIYVKERGIFRFHNRERTWNFPFPQSKGGKVGFHMDRNEQQGHA